MRGGKIVKCSILKPLFHLSNTKQQDLCAVIWPIRSPELIKTLSVTQSSELVHPSYFLLLYIYSFISCFASIRHSLEKVLGINTDTIDSRCMSFSSDHEATYSCLFCGTFQQNRPTCPLTTRYLCRGGGAEDVIIQLDWDTNFPTGRWGGGHPAPTATYCFGAQAPALMEWCFRRHGTTCPNPPEVRGVGALQSRSVTPRWQSERRPATANNSRRVQSTQPSSIRWCRG